MEYICSYMSAYVYVWYTTQISSSSITLWIDETGKMGVLIMAATQSLEKLFSR